MVDILQFGAIALCTNVLGAHARFLSDDRVQRHCGGGAALPVVHERNDVPLFQRAVLRRAVGDSAAALRVPALHRGAEPPVVREPRAEQQPQDVQRRVGARRVGAALHAARARVRRRRAQAAASARAVLEDRRGPLGRGGEAAGHPDKPHLAPAALRAAVPPWQGNRACAEDCGRPRRHRAPLAWRIHRQGPVEGVRTGRCAAGGDRVGGCGQTETTEHEDGQESAIEQGCTTFSCCTTFTLVWWCAEGRGCSWWVLVAKSKR